MTIDRPLDLVPPLAIVALHSVVIAAALRGRASLAHPGPSLVLAVAPAVYGVGAALQVLLRSAGLPPVHAAVLASLGPQAAPFAVAAVVLPGRGARWALAAAALCAWVSVWWARVAVAPGAAGAVTGADRVAALAGLAALAAAALGLLRAGGGLERRAVALSLPFTLAAEAWVLARPSGSTLPLYSTAVLVGGDLALLEIMRASSARAGLAPVPRARALLEAPLVALGAALLLVCAANLRVFPADPMAIAVAAGATTIAALAYGAARERLGARLARLFWPEAEAARERARTLERELLEARERVRDAEHAALAGQLAAEVAHEIRNPLGPIQGYARIIEREVERAGAMNEVIRRGIDVIREEVATIEARSGALLDAARPPRPLVRPLDLAALGDGALALLEPSRPEGVTLAWASRPEGDARFEGDAALLRSALVNLLRNALEAIGAGPGRITLSLERAGSGWRIAVEDDGPGLPAGVPARPDGPLASGRPGGRGLGLLIARGAARAHGGELTIGGREGGRGVRALLELPERTAATESAPSSPPFDSARPSAARSLPRAEDRAEPDPESKGSGRAENNQPHAQYSAPGLAPALAPAPAPAPAHLPSLEESQP